MNHSRSALRKSGMVQLLVTVSCMILAAYSVFVYFVFKNSQIIIESETSSNLLGDAPYVSKMTSIDWIKNLPNFTNIKTDYTKCDLCGKKFLNNTHNSTSRDLIITTLLTHPSNGVTFIRTLRSAHSEATVVVFVDNNQQEAMQQIDKDLYKNCDVHVINIGQLNEPYSKHLYEARHVLYYSFLLRNINNFDRVLAIDMSDTFFQGDPFTEEFTYNTMSFTTEISQFENDAINDKWVKDADEDYIPEFYAQKVPLNNGLYFGGMVPFLKYYNIFLKHPDFENFTIRTIDQGYLNYYYYKGIFASNGLQVGFTLPGDSIISARGGVSEAAPGGFVRMKGTERIPLCIHQYNRMCPVVEHVKAMCPSEQYTMPYANLKEISQNCTVI